MYVTNTSLKAEKQVFMSRRFHATTVRVGLFMNMRPAADWSAQCALGYIRINSVVLRSETRMLGVDLVLN